MGTSSARTIVASISTARAVPTPSSLMEHDLRNVAKAPIATSEQQCRGGHDAARALKPDRDGLALAGARIPRSP